MEINLNEKELIEQLRQGKEPAFRWLVENYRNRVFHTVLNILQDTKEAEDAAQETFIKVFESIRSFKEESSLSTWIYRIAVHKALDKTRRRKTRQRLHQWHAQPATHVQQRCISLPKNYSQKKACFHRNSSAKTKGVLIL